MLKLTLHITPLPAGEGQGVGLLSIYTFMIRIILIGYMGAGKTTIGKALAKALGVTFYDLDWYIETRMRRTVKQIFDAEGEDGFRRIE